VMQWDDDKGSFAKTPPNATISVLGGDGSKVEDAVVTLRSPKIEAGNLTFDVSVLEGSLSGDSGPAALFIDPGLFSYWHAPVYHGSRYARPSDLNDTPMPSVAPLLRRNRQATADLQYSSEMSGPIASATHSPGRDDSEHTDLAASQLAMGRSPWPRDGPLAPSYLVGQPAASAKT